MLKILLKTRDKIIQIKIIEVCYQAQYHHLEEIENLEIKINQKIRNANNKKNQLINIYLKIIQEQELEMYKKQVNN